MSAPPTTSVRRERPPAPTGRRALLAAWDNPVTSWYLLSGATALLLVIGLVMVLSSSSIDSLQEGESAYAVFLDQTKYALLGLPLLLLAARVPTAWYSRFAWLLLLASLAFQSLVFVPGIGCGANGNRNWVCLPGFSAQPSEAIKLALAVWLGVVLARKQALLAQWKHALIPAVAPVGAVAVGLVLVGHDLGTALILLVLIAGALFVAGVPLRTFAVALIAGAAVAGPMVALSDNRKDRILSWLSSADCDQLGACLQPTHAAWGLASGGWFGLGLGQSREKWSYLPEAHNDFIFAILGEELGLVGTLLVLGLFVLLLLAMARIIGHHPQPAARITTGAIAAWVIGQAVLNIAVVVGLAPVIGVPLPLVSAGGSALIMTMAALGVVLSFARTMPGAAEALAARPGVLRRSLAVLGRARG